MVTRKQLPQMPAMADKATKLREQLNEEQKKTEKLCKDLESPENTERWRSLGGEDPDLEQLTAKVSVLEARLHEKKEQLLEKELILEEVTTLTQKYRNRATDGRSDTLRLAQKVNEFQARIRDTTRRMMATVSELSMYQVCHYPGLLEPHPKNIEEVMCSRSSSVAILCRSLAFPRCRRQQ